jgi:hypothetical protein
MTPLTPEQARAQLATADILATTSGKEVRIVAISMAGVGVLLAVATALSGLAVTNKAVYVIGMFVYFTAMLTLQIWCARRVRVSARGWSLRYGASAAVSMALCGIGIAWTTNGSPSWALFAPYCVLVALPMVVVASRMARR